MPVSRNNTEVKGSTRLEKTTELKVSGSIILTGSIKFSDGTSQSTAPVPTQVTGATNFFTTTELVNSGTMYFPLDASPTNSHIASQNSDLILSSSKTSRVFISGNLEVGDGNGIGFIYANAKQNPNMFILFSSSDGAIHFQVSNITNRMTLSSTGIFFGTATPLQFQSTAKSTMYAANQDLILSSSATSLVAFSASARFVNNNFPYHINAVNSHLVLSSSAGSTIAISGNLKFNDGTIQTTAGGAATGSTNFFTTNELVSSGTLYFPQDALPTKSHIVAQNSDLILSSSKNSIVKISGNLEIGGDDGIGFIYCNKSNTMFIAMSQSMETVHLQVSSVANRATFSSSGLFLGTGMPLLINSTAKSCLINQNADLILSSSATSLVAFSSSTKFVNDNFSYHINAVNSHLVLSSSAGSGIICSGNLKTNGFSAATAAKTSQYSLLQDDYFVQADATAGSFGIELPTAIGNMGKIYNVKKIDAANNVIVSGTSGQTIDGAAIYSLTSQWASVTVISDGTNWLIK